MRPPSWVLTAAMLFATGASAQLKPEVQTGSLIPVKPVTVDPVRAGEIRKVFARCVYHRSKLAANRLLQHSDPMTIDFAAAKLNRKSLSLDLQMESCLGNEATNGELGLRMQPQFVRALLLEEAYLDQNKWAPQPLPAGIAPLARTYVSTGEDLARARGFGSLSDCVVQKDLVTADKLLRTMPGSGAESRVARQLAPSLGGCLMQGQTIRFTTTSIRAFVADGAWQVFGHPVVAVVPTNKQGG